LGSQFPTPLGGADLCHAIVLSDQAKHFLLDPLEIDFDAGSLGGVKEHLGTYGLRGKLRDGGIQCLG